MSDPTERPLIEAAIAAQEQLRAELGDDIVDATIAALRAKLDSPPAQAPIGHERRLVTVLFMDVVDSTRITRGLDPEEMMSIMDGALQQLAEPIRVRGGRVTKFMGDGFLAVFGLRRTRENDAEMAVRAGLEILEAARGIADEIARSYHVAGFAVRVGINTGLVATGGMTEAEDTVMGSAVNLASRIEAAAPPGSVLVSQSTYRQVRRRFVLEPAGTIDAKGFAEPVQVHLVTHERSDRSLVATRGLENVDVEMVGRSDELDMLLRTLNDVVAGGESHTVTISGDAGIGKSRLLAEFESRLFPDLPLTTFRGRASLENISVPNSLLRDLIERCFDMRSDDTVDTVWDKLVAGLGAGLVGGPDQSEKTNTIGRFLGYGSASAGTAGQSPQQLRDLAVAYLGEFFHTAAATNPLLLLLDDLQWADDSSRDVVRDLIERLTDSPVLTIALTRALPADDDNWNKLPNHHRLNLESLSSAESESLLDSMLAKIDSCPPELRTRLLEHAGGNPYYLEELVMMCIDDGVIVVDEPMWSVHLDRLAKLRVPTTLAGVIRARLDGLAPAEHTILQQASVVGRVFWDRAVARVAGATDPGTIEAELSSLGERQMIQHRATSAFSHANEYSFFHTLLRDATYEEVLLATRREYHGIVADWLIAASGDREDEFVGLIGGHLEKAGRSAEALEYLTRAGDAAWSRYAVTTAADFYERALALTPDDELERRYELLLARQKTLGLLADPDEQRRGLDELERTAERTGDVAKRSLVAVERTFNYFYTSDFPAALASAQAAVEFAGSTDDPALQSRVESTLAWAHLYLSDREQARLHGRRALELAQRTADSDREASALNLLGMIALDTGELSEARADLNRALVLARERGDRDGAASFLNNLAVVMTVIGDYEAAEMSFAEILKRAIDAGDRRSESSARLNLAWVAAARGDWETARDHAEEAVAQKRRQEHTEAVAEGLLWMGHALVGLGALDEAQTAYETSATMRRNLEQTPLALAAEAGLARVALARGDISDAAARATTILDHLDQGQSLEGTWEPLRVHLTVVEALLAAGDDRAERALQRAERVLQEGAEKIVDTEDRRLYLDAVPWHRRIRELVVDELGRRRAR